MNYLEFKLSFLPNEDYVADLLAAELGQVGFESFERTEAELTAYINNDDFHKTEFLQKINDFKYADDIQYAYSEIEQLNWNEEWEKHYFKPIIIGDECLIHSSFHKDLPNAKYDIVIDPKMSFGTGHHETTSLMIAEILLMDIEGKTVLDMGCGTAVLAILVAHKGAKHVTAIDIDTWCVENSIENIQKNNVPKIEVLHGDAELLSGKSFNIIIANINRNILLNDIKKYATCLGKGDELYMSGFYVEDIPVIEQEAASYNLALVNYKEKNNWAVVKMTKTR
ncbi:MAG: 50S ribosomal protein L11 methyltransferase [Paludibacter sp.]|nr:50S ribosomal protein L11 methyltransferase [Paludibacter sp.]